MQYQFEFRRYRRAFRQPLRTRYGLWNTREGIILKLTAANGRVGWGEIAPLKLFGSESIREALRFCRRLPDVISAEDIGQIPPELPACQFGFESAWEGLTYPEKQRQLPEKIAHSYLLPTGPMALQACQSFRTSNGLTFKWKIGVAPLREELALFQQLLQVLPPSSKLRLDANAGLNWNEAGQWLAACDAAEVGVEFLEQPLPPDQFEIMLKLSQQYRTPIALDESVATLEHLKECYEQGWRGIFVVKTAIAGSPILLREFCQTYQPDIVWSSVFETAIARHYIETYLISLLPPSGRATGMGTQHWFKDELDQTDFEQLWQIL